MGNRDYYRDTLGKRFKYNTELNYQFGKFGDKIISAFSIEGDWHYNLINTKFKPDLGIKLDYVSGDFVKEAGDSNPTFYNGLTIWFGF